MAEAIPFIVSRTLLSCVDPLVWEELRKCESVDECVRLLRGHPTASDASKVSALFALLLEECHLDCLLTDSTFGHVRRFVNLWLETLNGDDHKVLPSLVALANADKRGAVLPALLDSRDFALPRLLRGMPFSAILGQLGLFSHDEKIRSLFPLLQSIEQGWPPAMVHRMREPIRSIVLLRMGRAKPSAALQSISGDVIDLVSRFLDTSRPINLTRLPPSSMLWLGSDAGTSAQRLWARRNLGKAIASALTRSEPSSLPRQSRVKYESIAKSIRIRGEPIAEESPETADCELHDFFSGFLTALFQYSTLDPRDAPKFLKRVVPETIDCKFAGLMLGLGLLGKCSQLSAVEMMALLLCSHRLTEAASLLAIACKPNSDAAASLMRVLKVTINERPLYSEHPMDLQIGAEMRLAAPLALGLAKATTGDSTSLCLLQRLILDTPEATAKRLDLNAFVLNCGIAMALINAREEPELHPHDSSALLEAISYTRKDQVSSVATACLMALLPLFCTGAIQFAGALSLNRLSFSDYLLHCVARIFSENAIPDDDFSARIKTALPPDTKLQLEPLMEITAGFLCYGCKYFACPPRLSAILASLSMLIARLRHEHSTPSLSYRTRHRRLVLSVCHDLILFSASLVGCGSGCEAILRQLSDAFPDHLDYSFGRSHVHSLALALLVASEELVSTIGKMPSLFRSILLILFVLPPAPDIQFYSNPVHLFRLFVPLAFLFRSSARRDDAVAVCTATEMLPDWCAHVKSLDQILLDMSVLDRLSSLDEVIRLSRAGIWQ